MTCELCKLKVRTNIYYEDTKIIVLDCKDCQVPMVILKEHVVEIDNRTSALMVLVLAKAGRKAFGSFDFRIDINQTKILDHLHWHARAE